MWHIIINIIIGMVCGSIGLAIGCCLNRSSSIEILKENERLKNILQKQNHH